MKAVVAAIVSGTFVIGLLLNESTLSSVTLRLGGTHILSTRTLKGQGAHPSIPYASLDTHFKTFSNTLGSSRAEGGEARVGSVEVIGIGGEGLQGR